MFLHSGMSSPSSRRSARQTSGPGWPLVCQPGVRDRRLFDEPLRRRFVDRGGLSCDAATNFLGSPCATHTPPPFHPANKEAGLRPARKRSAKRSPRPRRGPDGAVARVVRSVAFIRNVMVGPQAYARRAAPRLRGGRRRGAGLAPHDRQRLVRIHRLDPALQRYVEGERGHRRAHGSRVHPVGRGATAGDREGQVRGSAVRRCIRTLRQLHQRSRAVSSLPMTSPPERRGGVFARSTSGRIQRDPHDGGRPGNPVRHDRTHARPSGDDRELGTRSNASCAEHDPT